jgi:hypothetical protein
MRGLKLLIAAGLLSASAAAAGAAPSGMGQMGGNIENGVTKVHGCHANCQRGPRGWHRHVGNRCERRVCRPWRGSGKRPDYCVKVGKLWYCEY